jgi:hypothetical protein
VEKVSRVGGAMWAALEEIAENFELVPQFAGNGAQRLVFDSSDRLPGGIPMTSPEVRRGPCALA